MSLLDKRSNRLDRLDNYRRVNCLTTKDTVGGFEIEVSPKAMIKLKKIDKVIFFSFEKDFGTIDKTKEKYWVRLQGEKPKKKTDFSYLAQGNIYPRQHCGGDDWGVKIDFHHIDISCTWGQLQALCEMIAKRIDKKYGNNCAFKDKWNTESMKIYFI